MDTPSCSSDPKSRQIIRSPGGMFVLEQDSVALFSNGSKVLFRSYDLGQSWQGVDSSRVHEIINVPEFDCFLAASDSSGANGGLRISLDRGHSFHQLFNEQLLSVGFDTADGSIYAGGIGKLFRSTDKGKTFFVTADDLPHENIDATIPLSNGIVYVARRAASTKSTSKNTSVSTNNHLQYSPTSKLTPIRFTAKPQSIFPAAHSPHQRTFVFTICSAAW